MGIKLILSCFILVSLIVSCNSDVKNSNLLFNKKTIVEDTSLISNELKKTIDFSNPALLNLGADIGTVFKAYYMTGQIEKMINLTYSKTIQDIGYEKLYESYKSLDFGYTMKFYGMQEKDEIYYLNYKCDIFATQTKKTLVVVIENDSSKIVPFDPLSKKIFID